MDTWIILVLLAQMSWSLGVYIDSYLLNGYKSTDEKNTGVGTLILVSCVFQLIVLLVIVALSFLLPQFGLTTEIDLFAMSYKNIFFALIVGALEVLYIIPYLSALNEADEVEVAPLFQTIPIFGLIFGILIFDELPIFEHIIASSFIIAGTIILNIEMTHRKVKRMSLHWSVILKMLLASFFISLAGLIFKATAIEEQNYWGTTFYVCVGMILLGICIYLFVPKYRNEFNTFIRTGDQRKIAVNALNEGIDNVAILAFYGAIVLGPETAVVQSMGAYQPIFILLYGFILGLFGSKRHTNMLTRNELIKRTCGIATIVIGSMFIFY